MCCDHGTWALIALIKVEERVNVECLLHVLQNNVSSKAGLPRMPTAAANLGQRLLAGAGCAVGCAVGCAMQHRLRLLLSGQGLQPGWQLLPLPLLVQAHDFTQNGQVVGGIWPPRQAAQSGQGRGPGTAMRGSTECRRAEVASSSRGAI